MTVYSTKLLRIVFSGIAIPTKRPKRVIWISGVVTKAACLLYQAVTYVLAVSPYQLKGLRPGSIIREAVCPRDL